MSQSDRDYSEKRDYIRMRGDADVTLIHAGDLIPAVCIDLSSSGMQVQAARSYMGASVSGRSESISQTIRCEDVSLPTGTRWRKIAVGIVSFSPSRSSMM